MASNKHIDHPLEKANCRSSYTCDGCKMEGMGERYQCKVCNLSLHPECMSASPKLTIQGQECQFLESPPPKKCSRGRANCSKSKKVCCTEGRSCDACGMTVKGFVYHCPNTDWDFHPRCAQLKDEIVIEDDTFFLKKQGSTTRCGLCQKKVPRGAEEKISGWCYSSLKADDFNIHVYCVMKAKQQVPSSSNNDVIISTRPNLSLRSHNKTTTHGSRSKIWLALLENFLRAVFSILVGDPTTVIASSIAHLVVQGFFN